MRVDSLLDDRTRVSSWRFSLPRSRGRGFPIGRGGGLGEAGTRRYCLIGRPTRKDDADKWRRVVER